MFGLTGDFLRIFVYLLPLLMTYDDVQGEVFVVGRVFITDGESPSSAKREEEEGES